IEGWIELCRRVGGFGRIFYRWRQHRIKRKSGNIADFCRRWGSSYRYMVVLDADSVMSGTCLTTLVRLIEANPNTGIIQTAGWAVWIAYDLPGSYEEMPASLLEELKRDRRWCHGNLKNTRIMLTRGLKAAHRVVFVSGAMAYVSALLWFVFLVLSTALLAIHTLTEPTYFIQPYQLFPLWPEWHPGWALGLLGATAVLLFLPKMLGVLVVIARA